MSIIGWLENKSCHPPHPCHAILMYAIKVYIVSCSYHKELPRYVCSGWSFFTCWQVLMAKYVPDASTAGATTKMKKGRRGRRRDTRAEEPEYFSVLLSCTALWSPGTEHSKMSVKRERNLYCALASCIQSSKTVDLATYLIERKPLPNVQRWLTYPTCDGTQQWPHRLVSPCGRKSSQNSNK